MRTRNITFADLKKTRDKLKDALRPEYPQIGSYETEIYGQKVTVRVFEPVKSPDVQLMYCKN